MLDPYAEGFDWSDPANNVLVARWPELCDMVAKAILPALDRLIEDNHGYPLEFTPEEAADEEEAAEKWLKVLHTIREGFAAHVRMDGDEDLGPDGYDEARKARDEGLTLFAKHFADLWD